MVLYELDLLLQIAGMTNSRGALLNLIWRKQRPCSAQKFNTFFFVEKLFLHRHHNSLLCIILGVLSIKPHYFKYVLHVSAQL